MKVPGDCEVEIIGPYDEHGVQKITINVWSYVGKKSKVVWTETIMAHEVRTIRRAKP